LRKHCGGRSKSARLRKKKDGRGATGAVQEGTQPRMGIRRAKERKISEMWEIGRQRWTMEKRGGARRGVIGKGKNQNHNAGGKPPGSGEGLCARHQRWGRPIFGLGEVCFEGEI